MNLSDNPFLLDSTYKEPFSDPFQSLQGTALDRRQLLELGNELVHGWVLIGYVF